jgi:hypothetical protein
MKTAFAVVISLMACFLIAGCYAQSTSHFQSVGGDYGKSVIGTLKTKDPQTASASDNKSNLWSWGSAPKGSLIQNGKLVADPYYVWKMLNYTEGWMGQTQVDPYTGNSIYSYVDPNTGETKSFYIDPYTGKPVFINGGQTSDVPSYGSVSPFYSSNDWQGSNALPPVFKSNDPWS